MPKYQLGITPRALNDVQNAIDYYNSKQKGLGKKFYEDFKRQVSSIKKNPFTRAVRYDDIRFGVFDKFPYAMHYDIEGETIIIQGVISSFLDPETNWL